jgi:hypothetical protein
MVVTLNDKGRLYQLEEVQKPGQKSFGKQINDPFSYRFLYLELAEGISEIDTSRTNYYGPFTRRGSSPAFRISQPRRPSYIGIFIIHACQIPWQ